MRIHGGRLKGRRIRPPARIPARPTTDIAKEALFNILNSNIDYEATKMLDLFGGTGCISYEFASRGCTDITLVELDNRTIRFIEKTKADLDMSIRIRKMDVFKFIDATPDQYDFIFAGPPYGLPILDTIPDRIFERELLTEDGIFVMEHNPNHSFDTHPNFGQKRNYGSTIFSFFWIKSESTEEE